MARPGAAELLRTVGLLADGPVRWGQPVPARGPGLYLLELPAPQPAPELDLALVGKWLDRVPGLRLDGERPGSRHLMARLASLWLPDATVLFAGATAASIGGRAAALAHHVLGDPRPHADGQWVHALKNLATTRMWWASTDAPEEYLDAVLEAFAAAAPAPTTLPSGLSRSPGALLLPWAATRRPTGERQAHGLTGSVLPLPEVPATPPTRVTVVPPGDADGASSEVKGSGTVRRAPAPPRAPAASRPAPVKRIPAAHRGRPDTSLPVELSPEAHARMIEELEELTQARRPEVVARIKAARELGDLRENSEYHAARAEQSFLEGRVQLLEQRLRRAVITGEAPESGSDEDGDGAGRKRAKARGAGLGSRVTVELNGDEMTWTLVGTTETNAAEGRISTASPVGSALIGATAGTEVTVKTPRGDVRYRVLSVE
jgi:transcription elongation factor GreA